VRLPWRQELLALLALLLIASAVFALASWFIHGTVHWT
jgi:hypothetical protein